MIKIREFKSVVDRRTALEKAAGVTLTNIGTYSLDEKVTSSRNCENMIGVTQVPLGIAGPLKVQSSKFKVQSYYIPLATTEGALIASVNRGCKAITKSGGAVVDSYRVGATRGAVFKVKNLLESDRLNSFLDQEFSTFQKTTASTSKHLKLKRFVSRGVGRHRFVRFVFDTQDAMGMNMATIATNSIVRIIEQRLKIRCLSVAGNYDVDKKAAWLNFLEGRGMKTWAEVILTETVLKDVLKTSAKNIYEVWLAKCLLGSIMSGSMGYNAQYANIVAAIYIATGQDPAHIVEGSLGVTTTEVVKTHQGENLYVSVYLPDLMVGTVGGGTGLATQQEALQLLGVAGGSPAGEDGKNSQQFAEIIAASVLAGEISLLASLEEGTLAKAHERLGRGK